MSRMFYNYDNNIDTNVKSCPVITELEDSFCTTNLALIYNLNGKLLGIEAKHQNPITLFFNVVETTGYDMAELIWQARIKFKLIGQNHKVVFEKTFSPEEIFSTETHDLIIFLSSVEVGSLKKESYRLLLTIEFEDESFTLFDEHDGLLIIR